MNERFAFDLERCGVAAAGARAGAAAPGRVVAGADEAGRGCLAGPLVAAAVCFDYAGWTDDDFAALEAPHRLQDVSARPRASAVRREVLRRARRVVVVARSSAAIDERGLQRLQPRGARRGPRGRPRGGVRRARRRLRAARLRGAARSGGRRRPALRGGRRRLRRRQGHARPRHAAPPRALSGVRVRPPRRLRDRVPPGDDHVHGVCPLHRLSFDAVSYRQLGLELAE